MNFIEELKRRKVFRVAAVYAVVAWVLIQVADVVLPTFEAPTWVNQTLIFLFILGFPISLVLAWAYEASPEGIRPEHPSRGEPSSSRAAVQPINYLILAIVLLMAGVQLSDRFLFSASDEVAQSAPTDFKNTRTIRSNINLGFMDAPLPGNRGLVSTMDFTPDGSSLIYKSFEDGVHKLYARNLETLESQLIFESRDTAIHFPKVSPNGDWVAFTTIFPTELHLVNISLGSSRLLLDSVQANSIAWLDANSILYVGRPKATLNVYSLDTNESTPLNEFDTEFVPNVTALARAPRLLAETDYLLLTVPRSQINAEPRVELYNLVTADRRTLLRNAYSAYYIQTGHLVYMRESSLWAVPFDLESLESKGGEVLLVDGIESSPEFIGDAAFAISKEGLLAYLPGTDIGGNSEKELVWANPDGSEQVLELPLLDYEDPVISSDGRRLAVTVHSDGASDIWTHDFGQPGILNRVTSTGDASDPLWSPDGTKLIFRQVKAGGLGQINSNGIGLVESYAEPSGTTMAPRAFTSDGLLLFTSVLSSEQEQDISLLDESNLDRASRPLLEGPTRLFGPSISPDGRFLAYSSNETGESEVYIRPFPDVESAKWRVSLNGGHEPKWGQNSSVLHYAPTARDRIISAEIQLEPEFTVLSRKETAIDSSSSGVPFYAPSRTDERFLFMRSQQLREQQINFETEPVLAVLVDNIFQELERLAPTAP